MSSQDVNGCGIDRGIANVTGRLAEALGRVFEFKNMSSLTARAPRDGRRVFMRVVKNSEASTALLPGQLVAWKSTAIGTGVVAPAASAGVQICGIVDFLLPAAGAAAGYDFLITVFGQTKILIDANAGVTLGDALINSASLAGAARTGTTSGAIIGRAEETVLAGGGALATATSPYCDFVGNGGSWA